MAFVLFAGVCRQIEHAAMQVIVLLRDNIVYRAITRAITFLQTSANVWNTAYYSFMHVSKHIVACRSVPVFDEKQVLIML